MTDEELKRLQERIQLDRDCGRTDPRDELLLQLVAEVRRLRCEVDKWEKWNKGWSEQ